MQEVELLRNDSLHKDHLVVMPFDQAKALLLMQQEKGWDHYSLPKKSKFQFKDGDLTRKSNPAADREAK